MSEYWKSTPKYWCKFCKTFVKDTKFDKEQHEASPKHQHAIGRHLRELRREGQRKDREEQRAKDEVARLNGLPSGYSQARPLTNTIAASTAPVAASLSETKRQAAQLAAMGIAVPEELRREMNVVGGWQTVSERRIELQPDIKNEEEESEADVKEEETRSFGVHKRKREEGEEEFDEGQGPRAAPRIWGRDQRAYPGREDAGADDIEALLKKPLGADVKTAVQPPPLIPQVKEEDPSESQTIKREDRGEYPVIKREDSLADMPAIEATGAPAIVFKKRRPKGAVNR